MTERSDMDLPDGGKSYKLVAEGAESTVVAEYEPDHGRETDNARILAHFRIPALT